MLDLYRKGNFVENPYNNLFEIRARDINKNTIKMSQFYQNTLLIVNISPCDRNFEAEFNKLLELKNELKNEKFEILAFPSCQIDNVELSDREMKEKLLSQDLIKNNLDKIRIFNRVYVNGEETAEVLKFCYRHSPLFLLREGKSTPLGHNFSKFLINKNGEVYSYYTPDIDNEEIEKNIKYLIAQKPAKIKIRDDFINFNKYF